MQQKILWDYKVVRITGDLIKGLNQLGADSWEAWHVMEQEFGPNSEDGSAQPIAWRVAIKRGRPGLIT